MNNVIKRREMYVIEKIFTYYLALPLVKLLSKTFITPNMVTILNLILGIITMILAWNNKLMIVAIFVLFYLLLDIVDGNLARYTQKTSKLGAILDNLGDRFFYNGIIISIGINYVNIWIILFTILVHNLHSILATYYIVPNIRKLKQFKRFGIKRALFSKGIIFGMDLSLLDIIFVIAIVFGKIKISYYLIIILYSFDIIYRLIELKINMSLRDR